MVRGEKHGGGGEHTDPHICSGVLFCVLQTSLDLFGCELMTLVISLVFFIYCRISPLFNGESSPAAVTIYSHQFIQINGRWGGRGVGVGGNKRESEREKLLFLL